MKGVKKRISVLAVGGVFEGVDTWSRDWGVLSSRDSATQVSAVSVIQLIHYEQDKTVVQV